MLRRTPEMVELAIDDYVVGVDSPRRDRRVRRAQGVFAVGRRNRRDRGLAVGARMRGGEGDRERGRGARAQARHLRRLRADAAAGILRAIGYQRVDRARYPEKIRRDCLALRAPVCLQRDLLREEPARSEAHRRP